MNHQKANNIIDVERPLFPLNIKEITEKEITEERSNLVKLFVKGEINALVDTADDNEDIKTIHSESEEISNESISATNKALIEEGIYNAISIILIDHKPLTMAVYNEAIKNHKYVNNLIEILKKYPHIQLDPQLGQKEELLNKLEKIEKIHQDTDIISTEINTHDIKSMSEKLKNTLSIVDKNLTNDALSEILMRFKKREPHIFELIKNTDPQIIIESDCLETIILGHKYETDKKDNDTTVYIGKRSLGKGGFGTVDEVLFFSSEHSKLTRGAFKRARNFTKKDKEDARQLNTREINRVNTRNIIAFRNEIKAALMTKEWSHDNIIKTLKVGNDFVITETGSNAMDLTEAPKHMAPDELFNLILMAIKGMEYIWEKGFFHGDIKPGNIVTFLKGENREVKIIDLTPTKLNIGLTNYRSPYYSFMLPDLKKEQDTLLKQGVPKDEVMTKLSKANDIRALSVTIRDALYWYIGIHMNDLEEISVAKFEKIIKNREKTAFQRLSEKQLELVKRAQYIPSITHENMAKASDPELLDTIIELINEIRNEFISCKLDPSRNQFAISTTRNINRKNAEDETIDASPFISSVNTILNKQIYQKTII